MARTDSIDKRLGVPDREDVRCSRRLGVPGLEDGPLAGESGATTVISIYGDPNARC